MAWQQAGKPWKDLMIEKKYIYVMMTFPGISLVLHLFCHCNHPTAQPRPISLIRATPSTKNNSFRLICLCWHYLQILIMSLNWFLHQISYFQREGRNASSIMSHIPNSNNLFSSMVTVQRSVHVVLFLELFFLLSPFGSSNISPLFVETSNNLSVKKSDIATAARKIIMLNNDQKTNKTVKLAWEVLLILASRI